MSSIILVDNTGSISADRIVKAKNWMLKFRDFLTKSHFQPSVFAKISRRTERQRKTSWPEGMRRMATEDGEEG